MALLAVLMVPVAYSQAQVSVGIGVGPVGVVVGHPYVAGPPVCEYGYYDYYPYACAPYGYYGASYFVNGVFIGAGPWYHGYYHRDWDRGGWRHDGLGITRTPAMDGVIDTTVMGSRIRGVRDTAGHTAVATVEGMPEAATVARKASTVDTAGDVADHGKM